MAMRNRSSLNQNFKTRDFWLGAALLASGKKLLRLEWQDGRAYFVFKDDMLCTDAAEEYWQGNLVVVAKKFTDALRTLKDRLHQGDHRDGST